ncbi:hypothetical protein [Nocardiopsis aegyptia]|uniref:Uncharacterized protein n=1 Tax=Nocardiopsis aegyptia TaxID=220378 RepID=A0A7Z0EJY1_9ACTN|nr:hypothetical protein [Nocardiopsis aegyptia]NYJ32991.1 hypothetical protein [Nocardiopsis aegyptia]
MSTRLRSPTTLEEDSVTTHGSGHAGHPPPPDLLWAHAGALAALASGKADPFGLFRLEGPALCFDDGGSSDWRLAWCGRGRAVLVGHDRDASDATRHDRRPVDLLDGAPDWLPWSWVRDRRFRENIGFVYWWDGGGWEHTPYPDDWESDGASFARYTTTDRAAAEIVETVFDGYAPEDEDGNDPLAEPGAALMAHARRGTVDARALADVLSVLDRIDEDESGDADVDDGGDHGPRWDAEAARETARLLGLTPGSERPLLPPAEGRPPRAPRPVISEREWSLLVGDAMARSPELDRPPVAATPALERVVARVRDLGLAHPGAATLHYDFRGNRRITDGTGTLYKEYDTELLECLAALREDEGDPERGRWLGLRLRVTRDGVEARRRFDGPPDGGLGSTPIDEVGALHHLRREMDRRAPAWRPSWADLLSWETLCLPPAPPPRTSPARPTDPLDEDAERALLADVHRFLTERRTPGWREVELDARCLVGYERLRVRVAGEDGQVRGGPVPFRVPYLVRRLRSGLYRPGRGTWFGFRLVCGPGAGEFRACYDFDAEPAFDLPPLDFGYALDVAYFPRSAEHTPAWLAQRTAGARTDRTPAR